jgi:hypothetical protein
LLDKNKNRNPVDVELLDDKIAPKDRIEVQVFGTVVRPFSSQPVKSIGGELTPVPGTSSTGEVSPAQDGQENDIDDEDQFEVYPQDLSLSQWRACERIRVHLSKVEEWCIDYTYGNPTLWIITPIGWYKIGSPTTRLRPLRHYKQTFHKAAMKFQVLLDMIHTYGQVVQARFCLSSFLCFLRVRGCVLIVRFRFRRLVLG